MKMFITSIISCVVCFVLFGISTGIFGVKEIDSVVIYNESADNSVESDTLFSGNTTVSDSWKVKGDFSEIKINSYGVNTNITRSDRKDILVKLENERKKDVDIMASYTTNSLNKSKKLDIHVSPRISTIFGNISFGLVDWMEDAFTGRSSSVTLNIELPSKDYNSLEIYQGSGNVSIKGVNALCNTINIGSGKFELENSGTGGQNASNLFLTLGSGSAYVKGVRPQNYTLDIGSGWFDIDGLMGQGSVDMGSGSGTISFASKLYTDFW